MVQYYHLKNMEETNIYIKKLEQFCDYYKIDMNKPFKKFTKEELICFIWFN